MFSIVIPLYNKEKVIIRTLESIVNQTFQEFEVIVVDDGSLDNSINKVKEFKDNRISLITQKNAGVSAARNRGIKEAKYGFIAFLDADDAWLPDYLMTINSLINKYPECSVFATQYILQSQTSSQSINTKGLSFDIDGIMENYFYIASKNMPPLWTSAICVKKEAMENIGGFPLGIKSGEDLLTWARLAVIYQIAFSTQHLSIYYSDEGEWEEGRTTDSQDTVGIEFKKLLKIINANQVNSLKKYIGLWHKMRASTFFHKNKKLLSIKEAFLSIYYNPWSIKVYLFFPLALIPISVLKYFFEKKNS